ncbi:MAG: RDD family protein [Planctomycetales bacterium]|nr:RDD family protein [Planctomycetales bacterium]
MANRGDVVDSTIHVVTPENIAFQYELAGPWRRLPAFVIDVALRGLVIVALTMAFAFLGSFSIGLVFPLINLTWFVLEWFYGGLFEAYWNGQTPGKRAMGLRVLTTDGRPINGLQAVLRNILRAVDLMPLLPLSMLYEEFPPQGMVPTFMFGLIAMTMNHRFQRLGDIVCGTMVVVEERRWLFEVAKIDDPRAAQLAEYIPPNFKINRQLARALAMYVERRRFFKQARRREIARHIAQPLVERFRLPNDTSYDLMLCSLYHRAFIADRRDEDTVIADPTRTPFAPTATNAAGASFAPVRPAQSVSTEATSAVPTEAANDATSPSSNVH